MTFQNGFGGDNHNDRPVTVETVDAEAVLTFTSVDVAVLLVVLGVVVPLTVDVKVVMISASVEFAL